MFNTASCPMKTTAEKGWPYYEYYFGERDREERKRGQGEHHWTGAESIEWYTGDFVRDTMHGFGEYRWRYKGSEGTFITYEGHFFCNAIHGYGTMSYPDGRVFTGLYYKNIRWGPGVESHACLREDVGLWRGTQLIRLAWRPYTPSITPDLSVGILASLYVEPHRIMLSTNSSAIGEVNSALDLLKQFGCDPRWAPERCVKLYPKHCTDQASALCQVDVFKRHYYRGNINTLEITDKPLPDVDKEVDPNGSDIVEDKLTYFAWNNNKMIIDMMKHCYKLDGQRILTDMSKFELSAILAGPRKHFKLPGQHEVDCRTVLLASYLGRTTNVVQLVNEHNVYPDVSDNKGNTALMYAACGDAVDIMHFLVEAGADVNAYNDSCCTPLGIALLRFLCIQKDIKPSGTIQAMIPPPVIPPVPPKEQNVFEWNMTREASATVVGGSITRSSSKQKAGISKKVRSSQSLKDLSTGKKKTDTLLTKIQESVDNDSDVSFSEEKKLYKSIDSEYTFKINDLFSLPNGVNPIPYIFEISDMVKEIDVIEEDQKKVTDKAPKKISSKVLKETMKPSKEVMWQGSEKEICSIDSIEKQKIDMLSQIKSTILHLLKDGAFPRLVKCPQPALMMAVIAGCPDLVRHLVNYGADANEIYPDIFGYTALDIAVSLPLSENNFNIIRTLLDCGSYANHRLQYFDQGVDLEVIPGPTLLHAALSKKPEGEMEENIRKQLIELLLDYNCDPIIQFKGCSAVDRAMTKCFDLLEIFIKCPITNLDAPINSFNQSILVKMFSMPFFKTVLQMDRLETLTNLLLFGADPLIECKNGEETFPNIFVFAKKTLTELENMQSKGNASSANAKSDAKGKQKEKPKKEEKLSTKSLGRMAVDDVGDYKQAHELMKECARLLYIRWLQAKLMRNLLEVIDRYQHRQWNMIYKEHKIKKSTGLWLTAQRCLEIWDILKASKKKHSQNNRVLKHQLCIVLYYNRKYKMKCITGQTPTAHDKNMIEAEVSHIMNEYNILSTLSEEIEPPKRPYVKPELVRSEHKFNVCFECILPFEEDKIPCQFCELVAFCSFECMRFNIDRTGCHPCSEYLLKKYFPSPDDSVHSSV